MTLLPSGEKAKHLKLDASDGSTSIDVREELPGFESSRMATLLPLRCSRDNSKDLMSDWIQALVLPSGCGSDSVWPASGKRNARSSGPVTICKSTFAGRSGSC